MGTSAQVAVLDPHLPTRTVEALVAINVVLEKDSEDDDQISYRHGPDWEDQGLVRLDKGTGRFVDVRSPRSSSAEMELGGAQLAMARAISAGQGFPERLAHRA